MDNYSERSSAPSMSLPPIQSIPNGTGRLSPGNLALFSSSRAPSASSRTPSLTPSDVDSRRSAIIRPGRHIFGHVPNTYIGQTFEKRKDASKAAVHCPPVAGIHGSIAEGCYSICMNGGGTYDDEDHGDRIVYIGAGGHEQLTETSHHKSKQQKYDQSFDHPNNKSLVISKGTAKPVRVLRGHRLSSEYAPLAGTGYRYDGLYQVVNYWKESAGENGLMVCKFELARLRDQDPLPEPFTYREHREARREHARVVEERRKARAAARRESTLSASSSTRVGHDVAEGSAMKRKVEEDIEEEDERGSRSCPRSPTVKEEQMPVRIPGPSIPLEPLPPPTPQRNQSPLEALKFKKNKRPRLDENHDVKSIVADVMASIPVSRWFPRSPDSHRLGSGYANTQVLGPSPAASETPAPEEPAARETSSLSGRPESEDMKPCIADVHADTPAPELQRSSSGRIDVPVPDRRLTLPPPRPSIVTPPSSKTGTVRTEDVQSLPPRLPPLPPLSPLPRPGTGSRPPDTVASEPTKPVTPDRPTTSPPLSDLSHPLLRDAEVSRAFIQTSLDNAREGTGIVRALLDEAQAEIGVWLEPDAEFAHVQERIETTSLAPVVVKMEEEKDELEEGEIVDDL